jgi:hypothetical protein
MMIGQNAVSGVLNKKADNIYNIPISSKMQVLFVNLSKNRGFDY